MANIRKVQRTSERGRDRHAWEVRYRDPQRRDRSKTFRTKAEAEAFADAVETDINRGHYLDPRLGKKSFGEWSHEWLQARQQEIKPTTFMSYRGLLEVHLLPAFGRTPVSRIRPIDIQRFLAKMVDAGLSRSRIRQARQLLSMILNAAVDNGYIGRNPTPRSRLKGKEPRRDQHPLSFEQVHEVARAVPDRYSALIYVLAYGGLRWGEAAALRRSSCNLLRNRLEVRESVSEVAGGLHYGPPKNHQTRTVVLPGPVKEILDAHLVTFVEKNPDALVFTTQDASHVWITNFRKGVWWPALDAAGIERIVTIRDLRHTCASLMHAAGRSAKEVKEQLGHSTIAMTLDTYTHLFDQGRDEAAEAMALQFTRALRS
ncbi:MAG: tyrosine-type recombinase/integrase [Actinobacteria bacterium]|nr:tyrosine-type recombinase/integrase [Actinomycetota bacterium]